MASPRQDRRTQARDVFGHVGVTFPLADPATPDIVNAKAFRVSQLPGSVGTTLPGFGTLHPDTENYPNAYLDGLKVSPGDDTDQNVTTRYITLPGTLLTSYEQDPTYLLPTYRTTQDVLASTDEESDIVAGQATSFEQQDAVYSKKVIEGFDLDIINNFFLTLPANENIDFPRVLSAIQGTWDIATGAGSYSENATPIEAIIPFNISLSAEGTGQGSASTLGDITFIFDPQPPPNLPVLDICFFLPNPVTRADILSRCSAIETILQGTATTVNDWPIFKRQVEMFTIVGQKSSASCRAVARNLTSVPTSGGCVVISAGAGGNIDLGSNVKVVTVGECIHGVIDITGDTSVSASEDVSASAVINSEGVFYPVSSTPSPVVAAAAGYITPTSLDATPVAAYPTSGIYLYSPNTKAFKWGYSIVIARVFDFGILA